MPLYDDERFAFDVEKRFSCDTPKYLLVLVFLCKLRSFVRMGRKKKTAKKKRRNLKHTQMRLENHGHSSTSISFPFIFRKRRRNKMSQ